MPGKSGKKWMKTRYYVALPVPDTYPGFGFTTFNALFAWSEKYQRGN
jgi:hypothetical protein